MSAPNPTPCSFPPCDTGPGEPCDRHEREWSHDEGSHELCGNECSIVAPPLSPERETAITEQITTVLSNAGAFCGTCGFEPGDRGCPDCERYYSDYAAALLPIARAAVAAELNPLRVELDNYEVMTPQSCPKGIHADWMADSEHTHTCPWCELADMGESLRRAAGQLADAQAEVERLSHLLGERDAELGEAVRVSEALNRRLRDEQLAGSALYAAMTQPTTPEQRQAALDQFQAVAQQVTTTEAGDR